MSKPLFEPWHYEAEHGKIIGADGKIVLFVASARLLSTDAAASALAKARGGA